MNASSKKTRVIAISSRGGHWIELLRLREAFSDQDVTFVTTVPEYRTMVDGFKFRVVTEASRDTKFRMVLMSLQVLWILLRVRPSVIVTTGAAPGFMAIWLGRRLGIRTLWVDSIANAEELSMSGQLAVKHADKILTQWEHLSSDRIEYHGAIV
ncbi:oligosaccharide biosynthesis protein Alg14 [Bremerella cremea]|uniref:Oligosaccharide biosynthesis protein Alg14 n=2 Tax=Pirellulales TaxID=2691354 RepID=A0A2S8FLD8_9BACT|nr:oligosaccharide biosynthesis protein Alg14 [Blastopirellula marina]RCS45907.1 oligosaccharide biosynthesis protein Alg14 [Bremerella cremea]